MSLSLKKTAYDFWPNLWCLAELGRAPGGGERQGVVRALPRLLHGLPPRSRRLQRGAGRAKGELHAHLRSRRRSWGRTGESKATDVSIQLAIM